MHIEVEKTLPSLSQKLFRADQVRHHEEQAAQQSFCSLYGLMQRAGKALYANALQLVPNAEHFLVLVGNGNNAGDGYICGLLALQAGKHVTLCAVDVQRELCGDAKQAQAAFIAAGGEIETFAPNQLKRNDIVIDALLGTGIKGALRTEFAMIIDAVNDSELPVLSVDVPSGINADTGVSLGRCIQADMTVTFVGIKQGLVTATGKQATGKLVFEDLEIGLAFSELCPTNTQLLNLDRFTGLAPRQVNSHKGRFGRLLCVGGNAGMSGAIRLAGESALRAGTGLVKVYAHTQSRVQSCAGRPELRVICDGLAEALEWANCVVIGPGLGQDDWAIETFEQVISHCAKADIPIVIDADALNLLPKHAVAFTTDQCVITPHSGEAARLLGASIDEVESNRFVSARLLAQKYNATVILKGPGTIIDDAAQTWVCEHGNPGMATAGMGDVLSGIVGAMFAQRMNKTDAAKYSVCIHGRAADMIASEYGERGMLASDLFDQLRRLINQ